MQRVFVGADRQAIVDRLVSDVGEVASGAAPRMVFLEAPTGWGKTRIVQELYGELVRSQPAPAYWPPTMVERLEESEQELLSWRKRTSPEPFVVPVGSRPPWVWLSLAADPSDVPNTSAAPTQVLRQLEPHVYEVVRGQRLTTAARKAVLRTVTAFLPWPTDLQLVMDLWDVGVEMASDLAGTKPGDRVVGARDDDDGEAALWRLLNEVWHRDAHVGPPIILVVEDAQFADDAIVDLMRGLLASTLPVLIIATGWPLTEPRYESFGELVTAAPPGLRVERLNSLSAADSRALVEAQYPGTDTELVDVVAARCGGNPYAINGLLLRLGAEPGKPFVEDVAWLSEVDTRLHAQMTHLLDSAEPETRRAVSALALIGYRVPLGVGARSIALLVPETTVDDATGTDWIRHEVLEQALAFVEPMRFEVATERATRHLRPAQRTALQVEALTGVRLALVEAHDKGEMRLLHTLHVALGAHLPGHRDEDAFSESIRSLLESFRTHRERRAGRALLQQAADTVVLDKLSPAEAARFAVDVSRSHRIFVGTDRSLIDLVDRAMTCTEATAADEPELRTWALLAKSRLHATRRLPQLRDLGTARQLLDQAKESLARCATPSFRVGMQTRVVEYTQAHAGEQTATAFDLARDAMHWAAQRGEAGGALWLQALADSAYYATRLSVPRGIEVSREVVDAQTQRWGTERHPVVASVQKDLAVRLARSYRDGALPEAFQLAHQAYDVLRRAHGAHDHSTATGLSARATVRRRAAAIEWAQGNAERSVNYAALALADYERVAAFRGAAYPDWEVLGSREGIALARAWMGDESALDTVRACLETRLTEWKQPRTKMEVRWAARELHDALLRHGHPCEAGQVWSAFPDLAFGQEAVGAST